jgi:Ca2+-binding RTX toxin-like protein
MTTTELLMKEDTAFSTTIDMASIFPPPEGETLTYAVTGLPSWLQYDAATSTLAGTPWPNAAGTFDLTLSATDALGVTTETTLAVQVGDNPGIIANAAKSKEAVNLAGTDGQDLLIGSKKDDVIDGGAGSDTISGGEGKDVITTGTGWDTLLFAPASGKDVVTDFEVGIDALVLNAGMTIAATLEIDTDKDNVADSTLVTFSTKDTVQLTGVVGVADPSVLLVAEWMA